MARGTVRALAEEVRGQPVALERFSRSALPRAPRSSIFVGAGDSYAAALAGFYASGGRCIALDPYSLAVSPGVAEGRDVFFISVSGRTASNIAAARSVSAVARRTTAITSVSDSELVGATDGKVVLPMDYAPRRPGVLSFSLSLLAVLKISCGGAGCDFARALAYALKDASRVSIAGGTTYFLGNSLAYPAAVYAAAKAYELLGAKAHPELLEEFSHLQLFSMQRVDAVNAFECFDAKKSAGRLRRALRGEGYKATVVPDRGGPGFERLFHAVFVGQLGVLAEAGRRGLAEPRFLASGGRLGVSDAMIY